jgi:predicted AAA+ superfamily ATPase
LLEVRLRKESLPFPVGRVEFLRLEPLTFLEFLRATDQERLAEELEHAFELGEEVAPSLHDLSLEQLRAFLLVGGLPEAVDVWRSTRSLAEVGTVHRALRQAYSEDLLKYRVRGDTRYLEAVLANAPAHYGSRFKVRHLVPGEKDKAIAEALSLLEQAMVLYRARPTSARTVPLVPRLRAARKLLPLDIGLALTELGVRPESLAGKPVEAVLGGRIAEAFVVILLLAAHADQPRSLFFWTREGGSTSNAEVDFIVPARDGVLPIEVKAGASGSLKSMHRFLADAGVDTGVRLSSSPGKTERLEAGLGDGRVLRYRLRSVPIYLTELVASRGIGSLEQR